MSRLTSSLLLSMCWTSLASGLALGSSIPAGGAKVSFALGSLEQAMDYFAGVTYSEKGAIFQAAGKVLKDYSMPSNDKTPEELHLIRQRLFILNSIRPLIELTRSQVVEENRTRYIQILEHYNRIYRISRLRDFDLSLDTVKVSLTFLQVSLRSLRTFVGIDPQQRLIESFVADCGRAIATQDLTAMIQRYSSPETQEVLQSLEEFPQYSGLVLLIRTQMEYLNGSP